MTLPVLKTRRLVMRPFNEGDAEAIANLGGRDFEVARWLTGCTWPYEDGAAEAFVDKVLHQGALDLDRMTGEAVFAITLGGIFIGTVAIQAPGDLEEQPDCPTLGYWLGRPFHGFGYATEAAEAVLEWAFAAFHCQAIAARAYEDNTASRAVLRKQGFRPVGKTVRFAKALDRKVSNIVVRLERSEFESRRAAA